MNLRIATFNANNLFRRATVLDLEGFSPEARAVLNDLLELNTLLALPTYDPPTKTRLKSLLEKYGFHTRKENPWFNLIEARGSLYTVKKTGELTVTATGRAAWHGWIELRNELVTAASTANTARVIATVNADVLCLVEIEDRTTLLRFNEDLLRREKASYPHCLLVDGNDPRGIDVGIFSRLEIRPSAVTSMTPTPVWTSVSTRSSAETAPNTNSPCRTTVPSGSSATISKARATEPRMITTANARSRLTGCAR